MLVRYILSSVCLRSSQFSCSSCMQYMGLCVIRLPIYRMMICENTRTLSSHNHQIAICHCLGLGSRNICAVCPAIFLWYRFPHHWPSSVREPSVISPIKVSHWYISSQPESTVGRSVILDVMALMRHPRNAEVDQGLTAPWSHPTWWRHQMKTFSALLAIWAGNSPVPGEFPAQRPATRRFNVFFDLRLNKRLSKQSWGWWFETLSRPLWRHSNEMTSWELTQAPIFNITTSCDWRRRTH